MRVLGHGGLVDNFKKAVLVSVLGMTGGCVTVPWDGNSGHGEDRIDEPLLTPRALTRDNVVITPAEQTISSGTFINIDKLLHARDRFTVQR